MGKNISSGCGKDSKDLGTEEDFKEAIRAVHEKGGRVILYVEPLIIDTDSDIARAWDQGWGRDHPDESTQTKHASTCQGLGS